MVRHESAWIESAVVSLRDRHTAARLVGDAPRFRKAIERLPAIARNNGTVVISGETGTGKELVARAVHYLGPRAAHPFVPLNCGALPDTLLEDELFGHERGAFTDARDRRAGLLSQAERGTLFLDEVDSLTPRAQVALLRVLQEGTYRALGGEREHAADVRFVAATNAPLLELVCAGRFRRDLYYRLCVLTINLPPLRDREEDILRLARHFLAKHHRGPAPLALADDAERALLAYSWPGNVRELENVIQRAAALTTTAQVTADDLALTPEAPRAADETALEHAAPPCDPCAPLPPFNEAKRAVVEAFERGYLERLMRAHRGNVSRAALSARKERRDFGRLLKKHQLDPREF